MTKTTPKAKSKVQSAKKGSAQKKTAKKKTAQKKTTVQKALPSLRFRILTAGMALAGEQGWNGFTLEDVARRARVSLADVQGICPDKNALLRLLNDEVDAAMLADEVGEGSVRDILFELFMRRFDALEPWRDGVVAVVSAWPASDPFLPFALMDSLQNSMRLVLEAARLPSNPLYRLGLGAVAAAALKTWCADESADLVKTMAQLDRRLDQFEQVTQRFGRYCPSV